MFDYALPFATTVRTKRRLGSFGLFLRDIGISRAEVHHPGLKLHWRASVIFSQWSLIKRLSVRNSLHATDGVRIAVGQNANIAKRWCCCADCWGLISHGHSFHIFFMWGEFSRGRDLSRSNLWKQPRSTEVHFTLKPSWFWMKILLNERDQWPEATS